MSRRHQLRIGTIAVHVEWPFFLIAALLGAGGISSWPGNRFVYILIWVAIVFVSVLVHELGHAVAYRLYGQRPSITLTAFWGLTHGEGNLPRNKSIVVSLAGPFMAMLVLGVPALLLRQSLYDSSSSVELYLVVYYLGYINLWWSIANLLPIKPLDGGNIAEALWGLRTARIAGIAAGAGVVVYLFIIGQSYAAMFIGMLALMNLGEAMQEGFIGNGRGFRAPMRDQRYDRPDPPPKPKSKPKAPRRKKRPGLTVVPDLPTTPSERPPKVDARRLEATAWDALRSGDSTEAERLVGELSKQGEPSSYLAASVAAACGNGDESIRLFTKAFTESSTPPNLAVSKTIARAGIAVPLAKALLDNPTVDVDATAELQNHLHYADEFVDAARVGELLAVDGRRSVAQSCYEVACSWSRAGDADAALEWLTKAVAAGFRASRLIDSEPDLVAVRELPGYAGLKAELGDT